MTRNEKIRLSFLLLSLGLFIKYFGQDLFTSLLSTLILLFGMWWFIYTGKE